jgi:hypothetical protein
MPSTNGHGPKRAILYARVSGVVSSYSVMGGACCLRLGFQSMHLLKLSQKTSDLMAAIHCPTSPK